MQTTTIPLSSEHISYRAQKKVQDLLSPLAHCSPIKNFFYGINYPDTSGFTLHTHADFYESWFDHHFPFVGFHLKSGWYLWDSVLPIKQLEVAQQFNLGQGIIFINHLKDKTEVFSYASTPDQPECVNYYLNKLPLLKRFSTYFAQEARDLIAAANEERITPPPSMVLENKKVERAETSCAKTLPLAALGYPFNVLSEREAECFNLIIKGYSNTDIGKALNIAVNTANTYINRIKLKLNCSNRIAFMQLAREANLIHYL